MTPLDEFEALLASTLERFLADVPANLVEAIRYSLLAPGKRIRPRLALACSSMLGLDPRAARTIAIALEMVHCFTLIHDDLPSMDNDDFRRGLPSNHKKFGEAVALLAGDALLVVAFEVFSEALSLLQPEFFSAGLKRFCWAAGPRGVIGGQAAELLLHSSSTLNDLRKMHAGKTGALFMAPILIPADFAGLLRTDERFVSIENFAAELGQAFQIADDLVDAVQDAGKPLSILYFMPPEQAREKTATRLQRAASGLQATWGKQASGLLEISDQVLASLKL
ncbi:MAG TPA: hypothetical protein DCS07_12440 [Bdellovibrionales bacterium]|nr:MAG: hypothetical protein A2Z97_06155 [Bdellovibrionales bacterium GWB1_52_6]OFZ06086.1 MAG: hypothetical protein A2X97_01995 [Bdellovibrionales bacterium GWA1_52_35]OFZ34174.1 MAG: hypothetical protein A2070_01795 [Bdellovibrionales bacterium GWC1_52_8]HAR43418.1 hypothetical protein [Bdellovibrionales bacterium]HCM39287.1 hypothetical protein [Bdellovibrionales bacterium]